MKDEQLRLFVGWWFTTWRWAHPSWLESLPAKETVERLGASRHREWQALLGVAACQPPAPGDAILQWLSLEDEQRNRAIDLAQQVCFPGAGTWMSAEHEDWCRSIAKAIRPGSWLTPGIHDSRLLLGAWLGGDCWDRLRVSWPKSEVGELALPTDEWPARRLETLWQALLWRVTA